MSSVPRFKQLYQDLMSRKPGEIGRWHRDYVALSDQVATVRDFLIGGRDIRDNQIYAGTPFQGDDAWVEFVKVLICKRYNGISSCGQSVLSDHNFQRFIQEAEFIDALVDLIKAPVEHTFTRFGDTWNQIRKKYNANYNRLLVNRTVAACTSDVTSTVNGSAFEAVFWWLAREHFFLKPISANSTWYQKNVYLMDLLRMEFAAEIDTGETDDYKLSMFVWYMFKNMSNPFSLKKQLIKYGAPGTGKTYSAKRECKLCFDGWIGLSRIDATFEGCSEVVQFHPSFGYEDFIEGLRPTLDDLGRPQLTLQNGIFKKFCRRAGKWEIDVYNIPEIGPKLAARWPELTIGELRISIGQDLTGVSWEQIGEMDDASRISEAVPPFFFIVDEINRAELSRVLGELMICLEYRGTDNAVSTQYAALNTASTAMIQRQGIGGEMGDSKFFVPHNLYFIGTMNTIDRSVESFDLALRRRFRWERINPDFDLLRHHLERRDAELGNTSAPWVGLAANLQSLNQSIQKTDLLGTDYEIGHAYLMGLQYPPNLSLSEVRKRLWDDSICPLLEEYLRGSGRVDTEIPLLKRAFGIQ